MYACLRIARYYISGFRYFQTIDSTLNAFKAELNLEGLTLGMQRDCAVFELVEGSIVVLVDGNEFLLESLQFVIVLGISLHSEGQFLFELV